MNVCRLTEQNVCENKCSHLCMAKPQYPGYTCACPNDRLGTTYSLHSDGRTCVVNGQWTFHCNTIDYCCESVKGIGAKSVVSVTDCQTSVRYDELMAPLHLLCDLWPNSCVFRGWSLCFQIIHVVYIVLDVGGRCAAWRKVSDLVKWWIPRDVWFSTKEILTIILENYKLFDHISHITCI